MPEQFSNTVIPVSIEIIRRCAHARLLKIDDEVKHDVKKYADGLVKARSLINPSFISKVWSYFISGKKHPQIEALTVEQIINECYELYNSGNLSIRCQYEKYLTAEHMPIANPYLFSIYLQPSTKRIKYFANLPKKLNGTVIYVTIEDLQLLHFNSFMNEHT